MKRFTECQAAIVSWGKKARFRQAKVGLLRKNRKIYLALITSKEKHRFPIEPQSVQLMPAAIRFNNFEIDVFVRNQSNEQNYKDMLRSINIILKQDHYRQKGKAEAFEQFIARIPLISEFQDLEPLKPPQSDDERLNNENIKFIKISNVIELPTLLWQRNRLIELTLTDCNLTCVPKQLEAFSSTLTLLNLSSNKIDRLPRTFCCKMNHLKLFDLKNNQIETLPIEIKFLSSLFEFNISNNRLRMIPSTFSDLKSLRHLNVANNNLSQLPAFTNDDIRLVTLDVSENPLDGASHERTTSEVHPSIHDETLHYDVYPLNTVSRNKLPKLFEISMLKIVRCDKLLKLASETPLPLTIVSRMQRYIFKCYRCRQISILPAYNSTDTLDYLSQVAELRSSHSRHAMTFMKLLCGVCFDKMSS